MDAHPARPDHGRLPRFTKKRLARIWSFVRPYRWRLLGVLGLVAITTVTGLAMPVFLEQVIDHALRPPFDRNYLLVVCGLVLLAAIVRFVTGFAQQYQLAFVTTRVLFRMRQAFYEHLLRLPMRFFSRTHIGEILTRMNRDIAEIQSIATGALLSLAASILTIAGTVGLLLYYNWKLFCAATVALPVAFFIARAFRRRIVEVTRAVRDSNERISSFLVTTLSGMRFVRTYGAERREAKRFVGHQKLLNRRVLDAVVVSSLGSGLPNLVVGIAGVLVFVYGGFMVMNYEEELGDLVAFSILQSRLFGPIQGLVGLYLQIQRGLVSVDRIFEYLEMPPGSSDRPSAERLDAIAGEVVYEAVEFCYEPGVPVLRGVDLTIEAGRRVAIVGPSGSGKSTMIDLLFRLHEPDAGAIRVDGRDIRDVVLKTLNRQMALVSQEPFLFHASLAENVRYGNPRASTSELERVIAVTGVDALAARLPQGLDTVVGERGARLSGGEKQRISMARALLRDPRILVLDEATSNLDWESDERVSNALRELMEGRTTIVITHRLQTLRGIDRVVMLKEGRIVADGRHEELLRADPEYRRLGGVPPHA